MSGDRFRKYKKEVLDVLSPSICAAKWLNATVWLNSGLTASCHHPPAHLIDTNEVAANPAALHNTAIKKQARREMQQGYRPAECEYCWKIEDLPGDQLSDRVFQSVHYDAERMRELKHLPPERNINPDTLEIAFDRTCNFACAYCGPAYSTTWARDIRENGPYRGLDTDRREHYTSTLDWNGRFTAENNPYIQAFWRWWPELRTSLRQLRITGGEPLLSPHFWKLLRSFREEGGANIRLAVNSNLGAKDEWIEKLVEESHFIPHLEIYTSNEAYGREAEYIRDGLDFQKWMGNVDLLFARGNVRRVHLMLTVNALCLFSLPRLLDQALVWKDLYGAGNPTLSFNLVRWPTFLNPLTLPPDLRLQAASRLRNWLEKYSGSGVLSDAERGQLRRIVDYLTEAPVPVSGAPSREALEKDLKRFLVQYDARRGKDHRAVFEPAIINWLNNIPV